MGRPSAAAHHSLSSVALPSITQRSAGRFIVKACRGCRNRSRCCNVSCYPNGDLSSPAGECFVSASSAGEPCRNSRMHSLPRSSTRVEPPPADEDRAWAQLYASVGSSATPKKWSSSLMPTPKLAQPPGAVPRERPCGNAGLPTCAASTSVPSRDRSWPSGRRPLPPAAFVVDRQRRRSRTIAPARRDPARPASAPLTRDPEFAKAAERFTATADGATPIAGQHEESRGAKAA